MTKHRSKAALIEAIQVEHQRLEKTLASINRNDMVKQGVVGTWSVKDVLAHLTAWEQLLLNWYDGGLQGKTLLPRAPVGMSKNGIDAINRDIFEQNRKRPLESVLADFESSYKQALAVVQTIRKEEMFEPGRYAWTGRLILADYIASNTGNHYLWAKTKIQN